MPSYPIKQIATNRKANHDYFITDKFEVGILLTGTEIKSIRQGNVNLKDSYASIDHGEMYINNMHISMLNVLPKYDTNKGTFVIILPIAIPIACGIYCTKQYVAAF